MKIISLVWFCRCLAGTTMFFLLGNQLGAQCTPAQRQADSLILVALYNSANGAAWSNPWNLSQPMNTWAGVGISPQGCVVDLFLGGRGLNGTLPAGIGNLSTITSNFWISGNPGLTGAIPASVGNLSQVKKFFLFGNGLTGPIPSSVGGMTSVLEFDVCCNQLTGPLPSTFGNLDNLVSLVLNNNQINGPIPSTLNEMGALTSLWIGNNQLTGTIPATIGAIPNLTILYLPGNNLSGCIPSELRALCPKVTYGHVFNNPQLSTQSWQNFCSAGEGECGCNAVSISTQPANQTADVGQTATFNVVVTGTAPFTYQWRKNGISISGANGASYTTPPLTTWDNGDTYSCFITNCTGSQTILSAAATLTVNVPPSWIGLYSNDAVNHPGLGAELLLDSANTAQPAPNPVKICADGSNVTLVKYVNKNTSIPNVNIRFTITGGSNADQFGYFDPGGYSYSGDTIKARFTHPKYVVPTNGNFRPDNIHVENIANGSVLYQYPVKIYHAPIVFIHGLWADGSTFEKMNNLFIPLVPIMHRVDYRFSHSASFFTNRNEVRLGIDHVLTLARNFNYSAGKVILIGHSMGGILSRFYLQGTHIPYRNDIIKLITLNTPHYGSEAANLLWPSLALMNIVKGIFGASNNGDNKAIENLRVNSAATTIYLNIPTNQQNKVASTTIKTIAYGSENKLAKALAIVIDISIFRDISDLIVSNTSQDAQVYRSMVFPGQIHIGAAANDAVISRCSLLITKNPLDDEYFTNDGFLPPVQPPAPGPEPPFPSVNTPGSAGDSINVLNPVSGQQFNPGDSVTVDLYTSGNISRVGLIVSGNSIDPISTDTSNVTSIRFLVPQTAVGTLNIWALGSSGTGWQAIDSTHIVINSTEIPDSLIARPDSIRLPIGVPRSVEVKGYFDGVAINLMGAPNLTVTLDTNLARFLPSGFLQGIATGSTDAVFQYQDLADTVHIDVYDDPGVLTASFNYASTDVCANASIQFSDASIGIPVSYAWTFPGGNPSVSTEKNPVVTYPTPGYYAVSLKTYFTNGADSVTVDSLIHVKPLPAATITPDGPTRFCPGGSVTLTASAANVYAWSTGATTQSITVSAAGDFSVSLTDENGCANSTSTTIALGIDDTIQAAVKVFLQGPYVAAAQLMHDSLRVKNLIPLTEPYTGLSGFTHTGGGGGEQTTPAVLAVTGPDGIVDWVFLELRSAANPALVLATRSALVQRDGDVVEVDGVSPVRFHIPADSSYFLAIRHRNHLGVQLGAAAFYPNCEPLETDFRSLPPQGFYAFNGLNAAQRLAGGVYMLWAGNGRIDFQLKYNGSNNDRNAILSVVGLATPNTIVPGYKVEDYNLDGLVKYNGSANDRNVLLGNVGVATPSAILHDQVAR